MAQEPLSAFEVVELRRYVTVPGKRDDLIALFEREFIEPQERCGTVPVGQYRDPAEPDRFIWLRGFPSYRGRGTALECFYTSDIWRANRAAANATLVDNDDVLLLKPAREDSGIDTAGLTRAPRNSLVAISVEMLDAPAGEAYVARFESEILPQLRQNAKRVAYLVTDPRPNEFPALPVRENEWAFVALGICANHDAADRWRAVARGETLILKPAARSLYA